jgi:hypothetical protein
VVEARERVAPAVSGAAELRAVGKAASVGISGKAYRATNPEETDARKQNARKQNARPGSPPPGATIEHA